MIQSPDSGGVFQYTNKGRDYENNYIDKKYILDVIKGKNKVSTNAVNFTKQYNNSLNFNSPKFKFLGQKVDVLVKGTKYFGNKPITEFLFNFSKLVNSPNASVRLAMRSNFSAKT